MALIPFGIGLAILAYYYIILAPNPKFRESMQKKTNQILKEELAQGFARTVSDIVPKQSRNSGLHQQQRPTYAAPTGLSRFSSTSYNNDAPTGLKNHQTIAFFLQP
jgi:hypothetical protein